LLLFSWLKNLETAHQSIINAHHCTGIVELTAIVGCWEKSYKLSLCEKLIAVFNNLMSSADQVNIVLFVKCWNDFLTEGERDTSVIFTPTLDILIRIWPQEIAEETGIRNICGSHNSLNLLERAELGAESTVHTKYFLINNSSNREAIETISESFPQLDIVAALALVIKTIDSVNGCTLVISSE
jgi:hypothetical protein